MSAVAHFSAEYYDRFLSVRVRERKPAPIRSLYPFESSPGLISLLAGKPNPTTFPFTSLSFAVRSPPPHTGELVLSLSEAELAEALQYGQTAGLPALREWVIGLQEQVHCRRRSERWSLSVGSGSQDLIIKAIDSLVDPGDAVLIEAPTYAGILPTFQSLHCDLIGARLDPYVIAPHPLKTDADGICSQSLRQILESWPASKKKPRVLYTIPYGCNPTGMTATLERRLEVLSLAHEHDFIILEDDAYYYCYYGTASPPKSYFALEGKHAPAGRVLRFDSFSKIISAGMRIGFVSGPKPLVDAIDSNTQVSNLQTSGVTQAIVLKLLTAWGYDGFLAHTHRVSETYKQKRDVFESKLIEYMILPNGDRLAEWTRPEAGMFFWFKLLLPGNGDSESAVRTRALERGVLVLPGTVFLPRGGKTAYVRAAFSLLEETQVDEAVRRLRDVVLEAKGTSVRPDAERCDVIG